MAYRIALKSLARRYMELKDEVADLAVMIKAIADELAPELVSRTAVSYESAAQLLITVGTIRTALAQKPALLRYVALVLFFPIR